MMVRVRSIDSRSLPGSSGELMCLLGLLQFSQFDLFPDFAFDLIAAGTPVDDFFESPKAALALFRVQIDFAQTDAG